MGNIGENWRRWEQCSQIYMMASGADKKDGKVEGERTAENILNVFKAGHIQL